MDYKVELYRKGKLVGIESYEYILEADTIVLLHQAVDSDIEGDVRMEGCYIKHDNRKVITPDIEVGMEVEH